jgi:acetamidase/formamidase
MKSSLPSSALVAGFTAFLTASAWAIEVPYDVLVPCTADNLIVGHYSATKKPVAVVKSGTVVRIEGGGGTRPAAPGEDPVAVENKWLKENNIPITVADSPALQESIRALAETKNRLPPPPGAPPGTGAGGHFLIGPVYVEDAEPGDALEVRILDVTPRIPWGTTGGSPTRGGITLGSTPPESMASASAALPLPGSTPPTGPGIPRPFQKIELIDLKRNAGYFNKDIEVPLAPFMGVMATCPPDSEGPNRRSTAPGTFGGNLDCKELVAGVTLYLPVYQKGALFYTGDSHAAQGDGEISGTAIETADTCTVQFILHKGMKLTMPRAETPTHYIAFGLDPDLNKAMKQAIDQSLSFIQEKTGLDLLQAYALASISVDYRITQVVDRVLGIHAMIPKKIFLNDSDHYWYRAK